MDSAGRGGRNTDGMERIPGGTFWMGSEDFYREERPVHQVAVDAFWMDRHHVTVREFARFVEETGHVTTAETQPSAEDFPDADPALLTAGSMVFTPTDGPVPLDDFRHWWRYVPGATWRNPEGPDSTVDGREDHPVVHVSYTDALAYATWCGKELPSEAEWEFAARGGLDRKAYVWGDDGEPGAWTKANTWQGRFPWENLAKDGFVGTSPVGSFEPNGFGLFDMAGNVWQWTVDNYRPGHSSAAAAGREVKSCCVPRNPVVETVEDPTEPFPRRVVKGGSHLCAPNYCLRYRPSARQGQTEDASTTHIGFRCVVRDTTLLA